MRMIRKLVVAALMVVLALAMSACAGKTETGEMTGTLTEALEDSIVIESGGEAAKFITDESTVYYMGDTDHLSINDEINVKYHKKGNKSYADVVTIRKHVQETLEFSGVVSDVHDSRVTVTGNSLTVEFIIGSKTEIDGDLSSGDEVDVVYTGNLSEYPVAKSIKVTKEKQEPKQQTMSGIVTDFTRSTITVSIDSAHAYRFNFDSKTKVTGVDKYVNVGDMVTVTFSGDPDNEPYASEIKITKKVEEEKKTLNGTISAVGEDQIAVDTGKTAYIIGTTKDTKFTGEKPAKGLKTTVTYTGKLGGKATATIVHCVKDETGKVTTYKVVFTDGMGNVLKTQKVEKGKAATAPGKPVRKGYTFDGWDKDFKKVTSDLKVNAKWSKNADPKPEPKPEPEPEPQPEPQPEPEEPVTTEGTITRWTSDGDDTFVLQPDEGDEITLAVGDFTQIAAGYFPEEGDVIKATYLKSDMKATNIELVSKYEKEDPQPEPDEDEVTPEPEPDEEVAPEPEPEPEEETAPEPEPEEEAAPEPEPEKEEPKKEEPKEEEPAEVIVKASATIISGDEKKMTVKMKLDNGDEVTLKFDKKTEVSSGYFPEKDDEVKITYEKNSMTLRFIQLVNRPAPEVPEEGGEE